MRLQVHLSNGRKYSNEVLDSLLYHCLFGNGDGRTVKTYNHNIWFIYHEDTVRWRLGSKRDCSFRDGVSGKRIQWLFDLKLRICTACTIFEEKCKSVFLAYLSFLRKRFRYCHGRGGERFFYSLYRFNGRAAVSNSKN